MQRHSTPRGGQLDLPGTFLRKVDGAQRRVQERWMDAEALGLMGGLIGQGYLGVDLVAVAPGRAQTLKGGAVVEPVLSEEVVEIVDLELFGTLGRPGIQGFRGSHGLL